MRRGSPSLMVAVIIVSLKPQLIKINRSDRRQMNLFVECVNSPQFTQTICYYTLANQTKFKVETTILMGLKDQVMRD